MKLGFTGTRRGMTQHQLQELLRYFKHHRVTEFHHGDCLGADAEAHSLALHYAETIHIHPCNIPSSRAYCYGPSHRIVTHATQPPLKRNDDIIAACDFLIACPGEAYEKLRSGTWATIRHARKARREMVIIPRLP